MSGQTIEYLTFLIEHKDELGLTLEELQKLDDLEILNYYIKLLKKLSDNSLENCLEDCLQDT